MAVYNLKPFDIQSVFPLKRIKQHLKIEEDFTLEDDLLNVYTAAAVDYVEEYLSYLVFPRRCEVTGMSFDDVKGFKNQLITKINSVKYLNENGSVQILQKDKYRLVEIDKFENKIEFIESKLPQVKGDSYDAVMMDLDLGYKEVPKSIIQAVYLLIADFYEYRTNRPKVGNDAVKNLLSTYRNPC